MTNLRGATALVIASMLVVVGASIAASLAGCLLVGERYETRDSADYGVYEGHIEAEDALSAQFSKLLVFPQKLSADWVVNDFYYSCSNGGLDNSYQLLLDYQLSPEDFKAEVERLQKLSVSFEGWTNRIIYDTENFKYPAYVTVYTNNGGCEFALIDDAKHRIIAVLSTDGRGSLKKDLFPQNTPQYEGAIDWLGFSIYQFEIEDGVAVMAD